MRHYLLTTVLLLAAAPAVAADATVAPPPDAAVTRTHGGDEARIEELLRHVDAAFRDQDLLEVSAVVAFPLVVRDREGAQERWSSQAWLAAVEPRFNGPAAARAAGEGEGRSLGTVGSITWISATVVEVEDPRLSAVDPAGAGHSVAVLVRDGGRWIVEELLDGT